MNQPETATEIATVIESAVAESAFKSLWDRVKAATEMVDRIREEKRDLHDRLDQMEREAVALKLEHSNRVNEFENEVAALRSEHLNNVNELGREAAALKADLSNRELELKRVKSEYAQYVNSNRDNVFSIEEKENLKNKIRDLIASINSHL